MGLVKVTIFTFVFDEVEIFFDFSVFWLVE